jgi:3-oxoacyl-[acyl-carrier-protein] synthase II
MAGPRRVVVTGIGLTSPIGNNLDEATAALTSGRHGIRRMDAWDSVKNLFTRLGAPAEGANLDFPRKRIRTMGRVAVLATYATDQALAQSGLPRERLGEPDVGIAYGSTAGSSFEQERWVGVLVRNGGLEGLGSLDYVKFMSHTCAANLGIDLGITGRVISTCSACVSGSQAVGAGFEQVRHGPVNVMICGGAEELHFSSAAIFDLLYATSTKYNTDPDGAPRPFDAARDGLVVGEGACTLVLEELEHAKKRGAPILAEVLGYATNCDGTHITSPSSRGMAAVMKQALADAHLRPDQIGYVNAHATGTEVGDIAESLATMEVFGDRVPVSSTKSFTGHTLGACGSLESAFCISMIRGGWMAYNRTFEQRDERCAPLDFVKGGVREGKIDIAMNNNFAFGGINTSLIFGRV